MDKSEHHEFTPWYRQFWPWFIVSIPATTVLACLVLITLAVISDDGLVSDDYYREGLAINKRLNSEAQVEQE